ncbi:MAG: hypothetical protein IPN32_11815 [Deltaproteobacteria bacterium]|nr:hypothetical protein [Deltaproteobacteria bacterium]
MLEAVVDPERDVGIGFDALEPSAVDVAWAEHDVMQAAGGRHVQRCDVEAGLEVAAGDRVDQCTVEVDLDVAGARVVGCVVREHQIAPLEAQRDRGVGRREDLQRRGRGDLQRRAA